MPLVNFATSGFIAFAAIMGEKIKVVQDVRVSPAECLSNNLEREDEATNSRINFKENTKLKSSKTHDYSRAHVLRDVNAFREHARKHGSKRKSYKGSERRFNNISLRKAYKYKINTTKSDRKVKVCLYLRISFIQRNFKTGCF